MGLGVMNAFEAGRVGGAANSSSIGMMIKDVVAQADKMGIVQGQAASQGAVTLAAQNRKFAREDEPINVFTQNPMSKGFTDQFGNPVEAGSITSRDKIVTPTLSDSYFQGEKIERRRLEDEAKNNTGPSPQVSPPPTSDPVYFNNNGGSGINQFSTGGQPSPAPLAPTEPLAPTGPAAPAAAPQLKSQEFQGIDPSIFQTPEGQDALRRIIDEKIRAGGGSI